MSKTYRLSAARWLREYTAANATPVYAAESEVSVLAKNLCGVAWRRVSERDASMTYHTDDVVWYEDPVAKTGGVTGLDMNVRLRGSYDAALFCGGHSGGMHRVYGNAACYRFVLPDLGSYPTLESLKVDVTSDPYNANGARIAVFTNSTGAVPTACSDARQGCAPSPSHSCTRAAGTNDWETNDTYADGVAPRREAATSTGTNWYPVNGTCTFRPAGGLALQKYLFVFVLMENYNSVRGNWVEGCSFIRNCVEVTLGSAISAWDSRVAGGEEVLDVGGDDGTAPSGVDVLRSGVTQVYGSGRRYMVAEAPLCGVEEPERKTYLGATGSGGTPGIWYAGSPSSIAQTLSGRVVGCSPLSIAYITLTASSQTVPYGGTGTFWSGGVIAAYDPGNDKTGDMPGLSFYLAVYSEYGSPTGYGLVPLSAAFQAGAVPTAAKSMLASGTVKRIFVVPAFSWFNQENVPANLALLDRLAFLVVLASDSQTEILGYLVNKGYRTASAVGDGWAMYALANPDSFGDYGLVACAYPRTRIRTFMHSSMKAYGTSGVTFDEAAGTVTFANPASEVPSKVMFYAWRMTVADSNVLIRSSKAGVIGCYGKHVSVEPAGPFGAVEGQSAYSTVVVSGDLERVGETPCSNVAFVDMYPSDDGSVTEGIVSVPAYDGSITPVSYDQSFRVIPVQRTTSGDAEIGIDAIVTSRAGILVGSSVANAASVSGTSLSAVASPLNSCLSFAFAPDKFKALLVGFSEFTSVMYGTTPVDSLLQTSTPGYAAFGLRNCVGRMYDGEWESVEAQESSHQFVNFTVTPTTKSLVLTSDFGLTSETVSFPIWRVCSSYVLVPFTMPTSGSFSANSLKMSWESMANCTPGSVFNVWVRKGVRVREDDDSLRDVRLYSAQVSEVGDWKLLGTVPAYGATSGEIPVSGAIDPGTCNTLLLTAWCPYDTYNPSGPLPSRLGVGTLDVNPATGAAAGTEASGWRPNIWLA